MFTELVKNLTTQQIQELGRYGIHHSRVSEWKHGKRLPTRQQAVCLAAVTSCNLAELQDELTILEAKPETVEVIKALLGKLRSGANESVMPRLKTQLNSPLL